MAEDKNKKTNNNLKTDKIKALEKQDVGKKLFQIKSLKKILKIMQ